jgi:hypothetical protein
MEADDGTRELNTEFPFTNCATALDVLVVKFVLPGYTAVMEWFPSVSAVVEYVATPVLSVVLVPKVADPSLKVTTDPSGTGPAPGEVTVTVAVNVTDCPETDGLREEVKAVLVLAAFTRCEVPLDVLVAKFASPE